MSLSCLFDPNYRKCSPLKTKFESAVNEIKMKWHYLIDKKTIYRNIQTKHCSKQ